MKKIFKLTILSLLMVKSYCSIVGTIYFVPIATSVDIQPYQSIMVGTVPYPASIGNQYFISGAWQIMADNNSFNNWQLCSITFSQVNQNLGTVAIWVTNLSQSIITQLPQAIIVKEERWING